jgi:hypothetical protein
MQGVHGLNLQLQRTTKICSQLQLLLLLNKRSSLLHDYSYMYVLLKNVANYFATLYFLVLLYLEHSTNSGCNVTYNKSTYE